MGKRFSCFPPPSRAFLGAILGLSLLLGSCRSTRLLGGVLKSDEERYRLSATVCSQPEEVRGEAGALLGLELTVTAAGKPCQDGVRRVFVSVGERVAMRRTRGLSLHQQLHLVGILDGDDRQTLIVRKLKLRR